MAEGVARVFGREIAFTLSHYRRGPNETNNMLATPDDISNLNLNNLAGSALGLWDHARAFLLSFPVLSFSLSRSVVLPCHPLFLAAVLSLPPSSSLSHFLSLSLVRAAMVDARTCEHAKPIRDL